MYVEHLRLNWRKLDIPARDQLLKQISDLLNIQFIEERYESKINKVSNEQRDKAIRWQELEL